MCVRRWKRKAAGRMDVSPREEGRGRSAPCRLHRCHLGSEAARGRSFYLYASIKVARAAFLLWAVGEGAQVAQGWASSQLGAGAVRWGQGSAGETSRHIAAPRCLNGPRDLEVIKGTFLLLLENAVLLKSECFLSRCCFVSSYEWKSKQRKTLAKQNKTSKPKSKRLIALQTPSNRPYRSQFPENMVPLFVNKLNRLLSRYILSSLWAEGTRIWAFERLGCNGYTLPLLSLRHGKGQLLSSKMCHCYKYDCIIYCKLFSKFIANY